MIFLSLLTYPSDLLRWTFPFVPLATCLAMHALIVETKSSFVCRLYMAKKEAHSGRQRKDFPRRRRAENVMVLVAKRMGKSPWKSNPFSGRYKRVCWYWHGTVCKCLCEGVESLCNFPSVFHGENSSLSRSLFFFRHSKRLQSATSVRTFQIGAAHDFLSGPYLKP